MKGYDLWNFGRVGIKMLGLVAKENATSYTKLKPMG
jgi:hypothetical protein